jgi:hypothetical protein
MLSFMFYQQARLRGDVYHTATETEENRASIMLVGAISLKSVRYRSTGPFHFEAKALEKIEDKRYIYI